MTLLYDGNVDLVFHEKLGRKKHVYTVEDEIVDNVTKVLGIIAKPALVPWAVKCAGDYLLDNKDAPIGDLDVFVKEMKGAHRRESSKALNVGSEVHNFCEEHMKGKAPPMLKGEEAGHAALAFIKWFMSHDIDPIGIENKVYSISHNYCGTVDLIAVIDGKLTLLDYKTSKSIYPENFYQTAAYKFAYEEETGDKIEQTMIVRLDKYGGGFEEPMSENMDEDFITFLHALELFRRHK
jgi:hypothetical protein